MVLADCGCAYKDRSACCSPSWVLAWPASLFGLLRFLTFNFSPPAPSSLVHSRPPNPGITICAPVPRPETPFPSPRHRRHRLHPVACTLHSARRCRPTSSATADAAAVLLPWYALHSLFSRQPGANATRPIPTQPPCLCLTLPRYPCSFCMPARAALASRLLTSLLPARSRASAHTISRILATPFCTFIVSCLHRLHWAEHSLALAACIWWSLLSLP